MSVDCELFSDAPIHFRSPPWSDADILIDIPARGWYPRIRSVLEYGVTLLLCAVAVPFILLAAILVKLTSKGPVFYSQTRLGLGGQLFTLYKIRSMRHNCELESGPRWSNGRDPRVTRMGRFLRLTHIDELPQLWNVLRGDMSLIGPRPERPEFAYQLEAEIPRYRERLLIRPGLSGLAQVQLPPDVDQNSVRRKLAYDLYYIENMSFWLDLRIFLSTILKMIGVPFRLMRLIFSMPAPEKVEKSYRRKLQSSSAPAAIHAQPA